ncbi:hypothetical protein Tco_0401042, partial [Tanacetum coccineum]
MDSDIDQAQLQQTSENELITFREFIDKMIAESTYNGRNGGALEEESQRVRNTLHLASAFFQLASKVDVFPGSDCHVAYEAAMKYGGKVLLGDRPADMNETNNIDVTSSFYQEMSVEFPTMLETLVNERDQLVYSSRDVDTYRTFQLVILSVASQHNSVVAVVGKGHLEGIKKHWQQPVAIRELLLIPSAKPIISARTMLSIIGVAVTGLATACVACTIWENCMMLVG